ncbi:hypothetical protein PR048_020380 [Dryococelus australis]|uniref:Uncharacterized protein n=1 Tax=Dryococelus australis TaxID=614101 RepID=A0ABQ9H670_9NEOP|nr:hypothetical protein PR048_020380 [Dryococelus australis]
MKHMAVTVEHVPFMLNDIQPAGTTYSADCSSVLRSRTTCTHELEERLLQQVPEHPGTSVRQIAAAEDTRRPLVWPVIHKQLLCPYHVQLVQVLRPGIQPISLEMCGDDPLFISNNTYCLPISHALGKMEL